VGLKERQAKKYKSIEEKLIPDWKNMLGEEKITASIAYNLSQLKAEELAFYELV
jgi:hypothetical protein